MFILPLAEGPYTVSVALPTSDTYMQAYSRCALRGPAVFDAAPGKT